MIDLNHLNLNIVDISSIVGVILMYISHKRGLNAINKKMAEIEREQSSLHLRIEQIKNQIPSTDYKALMDNILTLDGEIKRTRLHVTSLDESFEKMAAKMASRARTEQKRTVIPIEPEPEEAEQDERYPQLSVFPQEQTRSNGKRKFGQVPT